MKTLKECIIESILDNEDKVFDIDKEGIIRKFLEENYKIKSSITIKETKGIFTVDVKGDVEVKNKNITSLTNGLFVFGKSGKNFNCSECKSLKSLEGAPEKVGGMFDCTGCGTQFTKDDVRKYTTVSRNIYV